MLSDNENLAKEAERVLENWGRWCRDDWHKRLGYTAQPVSRLYQTPRKGKTKVTPATDPDEGLRAMDAVYRLGKAGYFDDHQILTKWYALGRSAEYIAKTLKVHRATVYRRLPGAVEIFWRFYQEEGCKARQKSA